MNNFNTALAAAGLAFSLGIGGAALADEGSAYEITITNLTRGQVFTPILAATHRPGVAIFTPGGPASQGHHHRRERTKLGARSLPPGEIETWPTRGKARRRQKCSVKDHGWVEGDHDVFRKAIPPHCLELLVCMAKLFIGLVG